MSTELTVLAWTLVLALVQVFLPVIGKTRQYGRAWNAGPRDTPMPAPDKVTARLDRAQKNLFETLPIFAAAVILNHLAGREHGLSVWGAQLYFWARVAYVPLYAIGVSYVRSAAWGVAFLGLVLVLLSLFGVA